MGWTVTTVAGPLGLSGRAYHHPGFGPGKADRRDELDREAERGRKRSASAIRSTADRAAMTAACALV